MGKWGQGVHAPGLKGNRERIRIARANHLIQRRGVRLERGVKARLTWRGGDRQPEQRAKTVVVIVVIVHYDNIPAADLRHEMKSLAAMERADERLPDPPIGPNGPDSPH